jgi:signal peptidase I
MSDLKEVALRESKLVPTYLGEELKLDFWVKTLCEEEKSMLIRKTTPAGETTSALLHISEQQIKVIPTFSNFAGDELSLSSNSTEPEVYKKPKRRFLTGAVEITSLVLAVFFLVFSVTGVFQTRVILTGSMQPTLDPGDVVFAVAPKINNPEVGKTVIYTARDITGVPVTQWAHRIISGDASNGWTIKGDANPAADVNIVPSSDISSVVLFSIPFVGKLLNPTSLILISIGVLFFIFLLSRFKE